MEPRLLPHKQHFIAADKCQFSLAHYVNGYIVSTIGDYYYDDETARQEVGWNRYYETFVFKARKASKSKGECQVCQYVVKSFSEVYSRGYLLAEEAYEGHHGAVKKYQENGEFQ